MADTVVFQSATLATPPDATIVATDDAGAAGQVQIVKLALSANGSAAPVTADADGLLVNLGANNDVTVAALPLPTGAATAAKQDTGNASLATLVTQTDTVEALLSGVALETGGNLAAAAASLSVLDDWDESDRAKANIIVGQAGVTAGAGAVAANTPRVTHASDDPVTTALQIMDDWDETNRAAVNPIAGQVGVQGAAGASTALTQRVAIATDANAVDTELPAAAALSDTLANPTTPMVGAAQMAWDGTQYVRLRTPSVFKTISLGAGTAETTIWDPAAGKKFRVMGFWITASTATGLTFRDNTAGTIIIEGSAGANIAFAPNPLGNGILSAAADNVLTVTRSVLSALTGMVWGTEE